MITSPNRARLFGCRRPTTTPAPVNPTNAAAVTHCHGRGPPAPAVPNRITSDAAPSSTGHATAVALAPIRCGNPRTPVSRSSSKSGSTFARCADTPNSAPATIAHGAGQTGSGNARVATAGSMPKAIAYGTKEKTVAFNPRLYNHPQATTVSDASAGNGPSVNDSTTAIANATPA